MWMYNVQLTIGGIINVSGDRGKVEAASCRFQVRRHLAAFMRSQDGSSTVAALGARMKVKC